MKASSEYNARYSARMGRLNRGTVWVSKYNNRNQWLQVDLGRSMKVTGIATQGHGTTHWWVTQYLVLHSQDGIAFATYREWSSHKVTTRLFYKVLLPYRENWTVSIFSIGQILSSKMFYQNLDPATRPYAFWNTPLYKCKISLYPLWVKISILCWVNGTKCCSDAFDIVKW